MTASDTHAPTISIRERYRDLVPSQWPVSVTPQPDELLSSWLHRLAYANGVAPQAFARVLGLNPGMWSAALDLRLPDDIAHMLCVNTGMTATRLSAMTLSQGLPRQLLLPLRDSRRHESSTWLQFCGRCLADDAQPYFRRRWRLASRVSCTKHGCRLRDRCPMCRGRIAAFEQSQLVPQHHCVFCGYDLRGARAIYLSPATRALDRCIDDICRLEAMTDSPFGPLLIRRLLTMPSIGGRHSTMILTSLSTSARASCARFLNPPGSWLPSVCEFDDDEIAGGCPRPLIPPANDHHAWIELLASALGTKRGRWPTIGREPNTMLRDLLRAYTGIEPI